MGRDCLDVQAHLNCRSLHMGYVPKQSNEQADMFMHIPQYVNSVTHGAIFRIQVIGIDVSYFFIFIYSHVLSKTQLNSANNLDEAKQDFFP